MARVMLRAPDKRLESPGCRHVADKHETTVIEGLQATRAMLEIIASKLLNYALDARKNYLRSNVCLLPT
jgi:hypothetical protein